MSFDDLMTFVDFDSVDLNVHLTFSTNKFHMCCPSGLKLFFPNFINCLFFELDFENDKTFIS